MSVRNDSDGSFASSSQRGGPLDFAPSSAPNSSQFTGTPPLQNPWKAAYPSPQSRGREQSHVVYGRVNRFNWTGSGNASVKTVFSGHANIHSDGGVHRVEPSTYLVINHGREYSFALNESEPVDGLSLFFDQKMISSALRAKRGNLAVELESPRQSGRESILFFERIFNADSVSDHLKTVHESLPLFHRDPLWVQESLHLTLNLLLTRHDEARKEIDQVSAVRAVTKEELYRRLYKARDFAYATLDQPVSLDDLAYVACLSTNYFLRSFRGLFKQTPHQFIIEKRIERASNLLLQTRTSVSDVCLAVGFQSLGSFSWLFKKRTGLSPEAFRRASPPIHI